MASVDASVVVESLQNFGDDSLRKSTRDEKARLPGTLRGRFGELAVFFLPDGVCSREFRFAQLRGGFFDERRADALPLQLADDAIRAQPRCAPMHEAFGKT